MPPTGAVERRGCGGTPARPNVASLSGVAAKCDEDAGTIPSGRRGIGAGLLPRPGGDAPMRHLFDCGRFAEPALRRAAHGGQAGPARPSRMVAQAVRTRTPLRYTPNNDK
eukprot:scaffold7637_cov430-Prasinococcus_capsulatus_cf.AAC.7